MKKRRFGYYHSFSPSFNRSTTTPSLHCINRQCSVVSDTSIFSNPYQFSSAFIPRATHCKNLDLCRKFAFVWSSSLEGKLVSPVRMINWNHSLRLAPLPLFPTWEYSKWKGSRVCHNTVGFRSRKGGTPSL